MNATWCLLPFIVALNVVEHHCNKLVPVMTSISHPFTSLSFLLSLEVNETKTACHVFVQLRSWQVLCPEDSPVAGNILGFKKCRYLETLPQMLNEHFLPANFII